MNVADRVKLRGTAGPVGEVVKVEAGGWRGASVGVLWPNAPLKGVGGDGRRRIPYWYKADVLEVVE